ncbi:MAG TPA: AraC family transcriptional regulator [Chthoniobacteraceae bacterium]|nr:AraC family transcriptional regulator [Chthoniobacteraceae bacterium]
MANRNHLFGKTSDAGTASDGPGRQVEILFHTVAVEQRRRFHKPQVIAPHRHHFWQLEIAEGTFELLGEGGGALLKLRRGDVLLLPPGAWHGFVYPARGERWQSVKFHFRGAAVRPPEPWLLPPTPFLAAWRRCLCLLLEEGDAVSKEALAALLKSLLVKVCEQSQAREEPEPVRRAWSYIRGNSGRRITVAETARAAGVAGGYLATLFKQATGRTVKEAIDRERMERARQMLRYADLPITRIAEELDFPDIFAFSRYFKRYEGVPPREFRRAEKKMEQER